MSSSDDDTFHATFQCDNCEEVLPRWDADDNTEKFICVCRRSVCKDCLVRCDECNDDVVVDDVICNICAERWLLPCHICGEGRFCIENCDPRNNPWPVYNPDEDEDKWCCCYHEHVKNAHQDVWREQHRRQVPWVRRLLEGRPRSGGGGYELRPSRRGLRDIPEDVIDEIVRQYEGLPPPSSGQFLLLVT